VLDRLRLRLALRRNRLIASPSLRSLADWFPPARLPARRYARALFDLSAGFVYAQVAQALVESGLLEQLRLGPVRIGDAAAQARLSEEAAETLLNAAASLRLAESHAELWTLGPLGAALAASPGVPEMIRHHRLLYADLMEPLAMLRGEGEGRLARLWRYDGEATAEDVEAYSALMAASQPMVAAQALAAYRFDRHRALLDVGGGAGAFLEQVRHTAPGPSRRRRDSGPMPPTTRGASSMIRCPRDMT
jgi:demethylspheroidene O-methyltransferase